MADQAAVAESMHDDSLLREPLEVVSSLSSGEQRKRDLVALADFGARTGRRWLVRDALLAMHREGLITPELAHIVPTAVMNDPTSYIAEALRGDACWIVADA